MANQEPLTFQGLLSFWLEFFKSDNQSILNKTHLLEGSTMRERIYNPNTTHTKKFYTLLIQALITSNQDNLTNQQTAERLNSLEIKTAAGLLWSTENVKGVLKKLRHHEEYPSRLHHNLLVLVYSGIFTVAETLPLFTLRRAGVM